MAYDFDNAKVAARSSDDIATDMVAALNGLDVLAREMERKWGVCRLPELVPAELTSRFYRQLAKVRVALREGRNADAVAEIGKMTAAWRYLDGEAERLGAEPLHPSVFEARLSDGTVIAVVRDRDEAGAVELEAADATGRAMRVYTMSEIAHLIEAMPTVLEAKRIFPGATVQNSHAPVPDTFWKVGDDIPF